MQWKHETHSVDSQQYQKEGSFPVLHMDRDAVTWRNWQDSLIQQLQCFPFLNIGGLFLCWLQDRLRYDLVLHTLFTGAILQVWLSSPAWTIANRIGIVYLEAINAEDLYSSMASEAIFTILLKIEGPNQQQQYFSYSKITAVYISLLLQFYCRALFT